MKIEITSGSVVHSGKTIIKGERINQINKEAADRLIDMGVAKEYIDEIDDQNSDDDSENDDESTDDDSTDDDE